MLHFARWNGENQPLEVWARDKQEWQGWQEYRPARDDFNRPFFSLQIEGAKTGLELPGIVDEILTLADIRPAEGAPYRAFVCTTLNEFGFPAKDRSGRLAPVEPAHLGRLMEKIRGPLADSSVARLNFELPEAVPTTPNTGA